MEQHWPSFFLISNKQRLVVPRMKGKRAIYCERFRLVFRVESDQIMGGFGFVDLNDSSEEPRMLTQALKADENALHGER